MKTRRQLTLFIPKKDSKIIESLRSTFNPIQKELIDAHITLCREDEIENLEKILENLENLKFPPIKLTIDKPTRFSEGKGVFLTIKESHTFDELRKKILDNIIPAPRKQEAHITIMHPRNSSCNDETFKKISEVEFPKEIEFNEISLIEQKNERKWNVLKTYNLQK